MPAVRTIPRTNVMRTISETSALVFTHLPVILSMPVCLHILPTFPYPVWNPTSLLPPGSVSRDCFLKNLKGRVSERTMRNTERYASRRYLSHLHFFPTLQNFAKKSRSCFFNKTDWHDEYDSNSQCGENDSVHQCAWDRWMSSERFLTPMWWERFQTLMWWERWLLRTIPSSNVYNESDFEHLCGEKDLQ
jgi:hypothetical protein